MTSEFNHRLVQGIKRRWKHGWQNQHLASMSARVADLEPHPNPASDTRPVIFFNASTRLGGMSLNAGFSLITSWALRLQGVPVKYFVCERGMSPCVLGTDRDNPLHPPPCKECIAQSRFAFRHADVSSYSFQPDPALECQIEEKPLAKLMSFEFQDIPLGRLVLPSLRWILRRHHLEDDPPTRYLYRQYMLSAWNVASHFRKMLIAANPQAVVVFNGMFYPEAAVRWVSQHASPPVKVITHEVGLQPFSAFFTTGEATAYPIDLPDTFKLDHLQSDRLDEYLSKRFKGKFSMAGVRFWPEMQAIDALFLEKAALFKQIVPVFTNVIFDTSQDHANVLFEDMFAWLDRVKEIILSHPETLFVIRAHPDESRPGKTSLESVAEWVRQNHVNQIANVHFIPPEQFFSSYELIERSKFVMIYNSTIGLEATLLGSAVLCAGKARFTQIPTVFFPKSIEDYLQICEKFLLIETIYIPPEFVENARRFLYTQVFRSSLSFDEFLKEDDVWRGYVALKDFSVEDLSPERSRTIDIVLNGILKDHPFLNDI